MQDWPVIRISLTVEFRTCVHYFGFNISEFVVCHNCYDDMFA